MVSLRDRQIGKVLDEITENDDKKHVVNFVTCKVASEVKKKHLDEFNSISGATDNGLSVFLYFVSAAIKQMLNLNQTQPKNLAAEPVWKVLIYDRVGQDIISPLISIRELRELGVTLHM